MNSQLYTAASGLRVEQRRMDTIANNLANVNTDGFRARRTFVETFRGAMRDRPGAEPGINRPVATGGSYEVTRPGTVRMTERGLDIALADREVLSVQTADGVRYTRAGNLNVNGEGTLTDALGRPILDERERPIENLPPGVSIRADGAVVADGAELGRLRVLRDTAGTLRPIGENLLHENGRRSALEEVTEPELRPGWLESSAANPLDELVRLIQSQRAFQSYQKLITTTMNDVNKKTVNDIAG